jgi:hypothetical protein
MVYESMSGDVVILGLPVHFLCSSCKLSTTRKVWRFILTEKAASYFWRFLALYSGPELVPILDRLLHKIFACTHSCCCFQVLSVSWTKLQSSLSRLSSKEFWLWPEPQQSRYTFSLFWAISARASLKVVFPGLATLYMRSTLYSEEMHCNTKVLFSGGVWVLGVEWCGRSFDSRLPMYPLMNLEATWSCRSRLSKWPALPFSRGSEPSNCSSTHHISLTVLTILGLIRLESCAGLLVLPTGSVSASESWSLLWSFHQ